MNEIQRSNLNFTIKTTPYAAYITLKKTVQRKINGDLATPAPPRLFLLQEAQEKIFVCKWKMKNLLQMLKFLKVILMMF